MKKQILITDDDRRSFQSRVNDGLKDGYLVVPGTLVASTAICNYGRSYDDTGHTNTEFREIWAVLMEKTD